MVTLMHIISRISLSATCILQCKTSGWSSGKKIQPIGCNKFISVVITLSIYKRYGALYDTVGVWNTIRQKQ